VAEQEWSALEGGEQTGDARVDAVLAETDGVAQLPVREQVAVFEDAHERLRAALHDAAGAADAAAGS